MLKAVILDYGGTLANSNTSLDKMYQRVVERMDLKGIKIDVLDFENAFMDTVEWRRTLHKDGIEIDVHGFFSHAMGILGQSISRDTSEEFGVWVYESAEPEWLVDLEDLLVKLTEEYKVALLSNAWLEAPRQLLRDQGYGRWFDAMVVSYDIEIPKPDPRIFQHTLNLLGVDVHEAVMIGNSIKADIEGAINAGLQAVWVDYAGTGEWEGNKIRHLSELPGLLETL